MTQRVRTNLLDDAAITGNKIGPTAVSTNNIVDAAITGNKIGPTAVSTNNIVAGAITDNLIANNSVTNAKLAEPNAFEDYFLLGLGS